MGATYERRGDGRRTQISEIDFSQSMSCYAAEAKVHTKSDDYF
jgi:hypothetical protein